MGTEGGQNIHLVEQGKQTFSKCFSHEQDTGRSIRTGRRGSNQHKDTNWGVTFGTFFRWDAHADHEGGFFLQRLRGFHMEKGLFRGYWFNYEPEMRGSNPHGDGTQCR